MYVLSKKEIYLENSENILNPLLSFLFIHKTYLKLAQLLIVKIILGKDAKKYFKF